MKAAAPRALPPLLTGARRGYVAGLVVVGFAQAGAAGATVLLLTRGLQTTEPRARVVAVLLLGVVAIVIGWLRSRERLLAERLGQGYVHEIRVKLVRRVLEGHNRRSLGATLTRASNDLSSVRSWVALGIAPLAVAVPMLLGCTVVLGMLHPLLGLAVLTPLLALGLVLLASRRQAYEESRRVRRERGRLAAHLADTLTATTTIRSSGGAYRELRRVDQRSAKVVDAAIDRARVLGRIRGASAATAGLATATVVAASILADLGTVALAAGLTVVGLLATPVQDLGRVVEYRQGFRAARDVLAPALAAPPRRGLDGRSVSGAAFFGGAGLVVRDLLLEERPDEPLPALYAREGDRIHVRASDRAISTATLHALVGVTTPLSGQFRVRGRDVGGAPFRERRELFGYAAQGMRLERTTISRAVRYRLPDASSNGVADVLASVGLADRVAGLPQGDRTRLTRGGEPLTPPDRARLLLARAVYGDPPLLVLDHLDDELGDEGRQQLRTLLADYPGIVLLASDDPAALMTPTRRWDVG